MTDNNISEIKKAEEEAKKVVEKARVEVENEKGKIRDDIKNSEAVAKEKLQPRMEEIKKETDTAIKDYEKIAGEEQGVVMEKLDDVGGERMEKAASLVIDCLTK
ncbi:hypothetical protein HQ544_03835 [Candidatus Falkowbacteria bacterium]|nr:hypothetical protein [Candidatus Falkowbacteria bacterium]